MCVNNNNEEFKENEIAKNEFNDSSSSIDNNVCNNEQTGKYVYNRCFQRGERL